MAHCVIASLYGHIALGHYDDISSTRGLNEHRFFCHQMARVYFVYNICSVISQQVSNERSA